MNLWDIKAGAWNEQLLSLASGSSDTTGLRNKLGNVPEDGGGSFGSISNYFVDRYGFNSSCRVIPFTGDNPSTILALPLQPLDAIVSLGTSTTFLMSTPHYKLGLYFPRPEIVPNVRAGTWRFTYEPSSQVLSENE